VKAKSKLDWVKMLGELEGFQEAYGHLRVEEQQKRYPELSRWLRGIQGRLETLTYAQILGLDNLGFFERLDQRWLDSYARLRRFKETTGHCDVPARWPADRPLARWFRQQRARAAKGIMAPWRRKLLADLGFCFQPRGRGILADWDEVIRRLTRYRERFGHCDVSTEWREDRTLVYWVERIRSIRKTLGQKRIRQLDALGFEWDPLHGRWEKRFRELEAFKQQHGHCCVADKSTVLGRWVGNLRRNKEKLSRERIRRLEQLGFDWAPLKTVWLTRYKELLAYRRRFGHANVPAEWAENPQLATWVVELRFRKAGLSPEEVAMLDKAGLDWDPYETAWMQYYEELKAFRRQNGHCNPPVSKSALGRWVHHLRGRAYKILPHRKKLLDEIGFEWHGKLHNSWTKQYEELKAYQARHGRPPAPLASPLGKWVSNQRTAHRKGTMPPERKELLEKIGFVWRVSPRR
jgi:hypothetical protein